MGTVAGGERPLEPSLPGDEGDPICAVNRDEDVVARHGDMVWFGADGRSPGHVPRSQLDAQEHAPTVVG